jgi:anti-sigma B factor antagonist
VRLRLAGAVDIDTVPELEAQLTELREAGFRRIILDLGRLGFMDSSGLRLILRWHAAALSGGYSLAVVPGPPAVQRVFELTDTLDVLPFTRR